MENESESERKRERAIFEIASNWDPKIGSVNDVDLFKREISLWESVPFVISIYIIDDDASSFLFQDSKSKIWYQIAKVSSRQIKFGQNSDCCYITGLGASRKSARSDILVCLFVCQTNQTPSKISSSPMASEERNTSIDVIDFFSFISIYQKNNTSVRPVNWYEWQLNLINDTDELCNRIHSGRYTRQQQQQQQKKKRPKINVSTKSASWRRRKMLNLRPSFLFLLFGHVADIQKENSRKQNIFEKKKKKLANACFVWDWLDRQTGLAKLGLFLSNKQTNKQTGELKKLLYKK